MKKFIGFIIILLLVMSSCSYEKPDNILMEGLPKSDFTIEYACFLNQDTSIIIGRHKKYMNQESARYVNSLEIYISESQGANWNLQTKLPFDTLIHIGNVIKSDSDLFTSLFLQSGDAYLLHIKLYPTYTAKIVATGKNRITPIAFHDNLLYSIAEYNRGYNLIIMDSTYRIINRVPSPSLSQGFLWNEKLTAIKRHINGRNLFVLNDDSRWDSYMCPLNTSFIAELKDGICVAGNNESKDMEICFYSHSLLSPHLLYSNNDYTFLREMITDKDKSIILVLGKKSGAFVKYCLAVSNNSGKDWQQLEIPNSELYGACTLYKGSIYLFMINNDLIRYKL